MAKYENLRIVNLAYDDNAETLTMRLMGLPPEKPNNVREDLWFPIAPSFTIVVPVESLSAVTPSGVYTDPDTAQRYKISYDGTKWGEPSAVDELGNTGTTGTVD